MRVTTLQAMVTIVASMVSAIAVVTAAVLWLSTQFHQIDTRLRMIESFISGGVTQNQVELWRMQLQAENPTLSVPVFPTRREAK
jgi:hypothetical protein